MADMNELLVRIDSTTEGLRREMRRAEQTVDKSSRSIDRHLEKIDTAFAEIKRSATIAAAAIGIAGVALVAMTARQAQAVRETRAMARVLGTSTGELQAFGYAAEQVGIQTDKAADILKDLQDRIGEAARTGGGELAPILEQIGISAQKLSQAGPIKALAMLADAIKNLPKAQQVHVMESIADDASRLLPLLAEGGKLLREFSAQARIKNVALDEEEVDRMIRANKAIRNMQGTLEGLQNTIAIAVGPSITGLANALSLQLTEAMQDNQDQAIQWSNVFGDTIAFTLDAGSSAINVLSLSFKTLGATIAMVAAQLNAVMTGNFGGMDAITQAYGEDLAQIGKTHLLEFDASRYRDALAKARQMASKDSTTTYFPLTYGGSAGGGGSGGTIGAAAPTGMTAAEQRNIDAIRQAQAAYQDWLSLQDQRKQGIQDLMMQFGTRGQKQQIWFNNQVSRIHELVGHNELAAQLIAQAWDESRERFNQGTSEMSEFARQAAHNMQDIFADFLFDPFKDGLDGLLKSFSEMLRKMTAQIAASQILNALVGKEFMDGGSLGGLLGGIDLSFLPGLATGGTATAGSPYIVGERGPELFVPRHTGTVIPNGAAIGASATSSRTMQPIINITNEGQPLEVESARVSMTDNQMQIDMAVRSSIKRQVANGELDDAMSVYGNRRTVF